MSTKACCFSGAAALAALLVATPSCSSQTISSDVLVGGGSGGTGVGDATPDATGGGDSGVSTGSGGTKDSSTNTDGSADVEVSTCDTPMTTKPPKNDLDLIDGRTPDWSWWIVTGRADAGTLTFMPAASPPAPTPVTADGRTFLQLAGTGLGLGDYGLLGFSPRPSAAGGEPSDLSDAPGLTFDAKGTHAWIVINTVDVVPRFCKCSGADCFNGYRYELPATETWATYTVTWDQLELAPYVVNRPVFDAKNITTISFGGHGENFDVFIDNLRLARANLDAGADAE